MGLPFFRWRPHTRSRSPVTISLGEELSDLQVTPIRSVSDAMTMSGNYSRIVKRPSIAVRIVLERFTDRELFRRLSAMINHLERGGIVAFGTDSAKAYGATTLVEYLQGTRDITVGPNIYKEYHSDSALFTRLVGSDTDPYGDEFVIENAAPEAAREYFACYNSTNRIDIGEGHATYKIDEHTTGRNLRLQNDYPQGSLVRYADFYPSLFLPASGVGGALLTHEHRIAYTLDLRLEYVIPDYEWLGEQPPVEKEIPNDNDNPDPVVQPGVNEFEEKVLKDSTAAKDVEEPKMWWE